MFAQFLSILVSVVLAQTIGQFDLLNLFEQFNTTSPDIIKAYQLVKVPDAWQKVKDTPSLNLNRVTAGIIDTGVDSSHPEFTDPKVNFGNSPPDALKDDPAIRPRGHGTQVAGIVGANNVSGISTYPSPQMNGILSGVLSPNLYSLEVRRFKTFIKTNQTLLGFQNVTTIGKLSEVLVGMNTNVTNLSIGWLKCSTFLSLNLPSVFGCVKDKYFPDVTNFFKEGFESQHDTLFVVSAGNEGTDSTNSTPANIKLVNTFTVGATDLSDKRADFPFPARSSNFGSGVDISAPGIGVYTPSIRGKGNFPQEGGNYEFNFSGTSASAPMVTGVAGLIKAIRPELSPAQIKNILTKTENTDPVITEPDKPIGRRLNALKAICDPLVLNCPPPQPPQLPIWPMFQKNAQRTGLSDVSGPAFATSSAVTLKWQKSFAIPSGFSPIIGTQAIYVGAGSNLFAFNKTNGNQIWQASIPAGAVNGALGPDGTIYVCGLNTNQQSILTAVNPADGSIKWQFQVGLFRPCNDPAVAQDGTIFTTVPPPLNTQTAVVVAINPDGTQKWRHEEGNLSTTAPALSNDEFQVYVGFYDTLKAFNAQNGQILWNKNTPIFSYLITVDSNDRILDNIINGPIAAFSKTGSFLWQSGSVSAMALYPGNKIFATNPDGYKFLNASDGSLISFGSWPSGFQLPGHTFPIVDKDGLIYLPLAIFGSPAQVRLFVFDGSGAVRWIFDIPSALNFAAVGGSALNSDGMLYLIVQEKLLAF